MTDPRAEGTLGRLHAAGVQVIPDLCWCSISEPVFPVEAKALMTNSGKYAHYGPGLSGRHVRFRSLAACAQTALTGRVPQNLPEWERALKPKVSREKQRQGMDRIVIKLCRLSLFDRRSFTYRSGFYRLSLCSLRRKKASSRPDLDTSIMLPCKTK